MLRRSALKDSSYRKLVASVGIGSANQRNREEWLKSTLARLPPGSRLLDAGAGERRYEVLCSHLDYVSQDFGEYDGSGDGVGLQKKKWNTTEIDIVSNIASIPVGDASFDAVMCVEVLEHVPRPLDAFREFHRILRPGGRLIVTAPFNSLTHYAPYFFYTGYSDYFYRASLGDAGFSIDEIDRNGSYFEYLAQELVRLEAVRDRYAPDDRSVRHQVRSSVLTLLRELKAMSAADQGSSELLCFGLHVLATRQP